MEKIGRARREKQLSDVWKLFSCQEGGCTLLRWVLELLHATLNLFFRLYDTAGMPRHYCPLHFTERRRNFGCYPLLPGGLSPGEGLMPPLQQRSVLIPEYQPFLPGLLSHVHVWSASQLLTALV